MSVHIPNIAAGKHRIAAVASQPAITPAEAIKLLTPFVGTFREHHRGDGSRVDITHRTRSIDADIRAVGPDGIKIVFDGFGEVVPWSAVKSVTITGGRAMRIAA